MPAAVKARSPNHWTAREFPHLTFLSLSFLICRMVMRMLFLACPCPCPCSLMSSPWIERPQCCVNTGAHERVRPSVLLSPLCPQLSQSDMLHVEPALLQYPDWRGHLL